MGSVEVDPPRKYKYRNGIKTTRVQSVHPNLRYGVLFLTFEEKRMKNWEDLTMKNIKLMKSTTA